MARNAPAHSAGGNDLAQFRSYLARYPMLPLRDRTWAKDIAQATLLAAIERGDAGR